MSVIKCPVVGWDWTEHSGLSRPLNVHMFLLNRELWPKSCSMYDFWRSHRPKLFCYGILIKGIVQQKTMRILLLFIHPYEYMCSRPVCCCFCRGTQKFVISQKIHFCRIVTHLLLMPPQFIVIWNIQKRQKKEVHTDCALYFMVLYCLFRSVLHTNLFYGWRRHVISKSCNKASHTFMMHWDIFEALLLFGGKAYSVLQLFENSSESLLKNNSIWVWNDNEQIMY